MAEKTAISWCDHTWSPWEGCTKVSPGCDHCYAAARNGRFAKGSNWGPGAPRRRTADWKKPRQWNAAAQAAGGRRTIFPSLCDPFDNEVDPSWRAELFALIADTPHLTWLLLTKRIGNVRGMLPPTVNCFDAVFPNVWLGATVVNQAEADRDVPKLLATPATVRFLSIEPMLGPIDLTLDGLVCQACPWCAEHPSDPDTGAVEHCRRCEWTWKSDEWGIDWVICGGESGPKARPMHPDWVRSLRDECSSAGVPFHFKQWGEWSPEHGGHAVHDWHRWPIEPNEPAGGVWSYRIGKAAAGRLLDSVEHNGFPR